MKKALLAGTALVMFVSGSAMAADLSRPPPGPAPVYSKAPMAPLFSWSGCYIGVEGGGIWGSAHNTSFDPLLLGDITGSYNLSGWLIGGTLGCNYQVGQFVFGLEGDDSWTNKNGSIFAIPPFLTSSLIQTKESWIATGRGRIGYAFADRWLLYVTGGGAATSATLTITDATFGANASQSNTRWGWTFGGGLEWGIDRNWSIKAEYLHVDFGNSNYFVPHIVLPNTYTFLNQNVKLTDEIVRAGVNYRLGG